MFVISSKNKIIKRLNTRSLKTFDVYKKHTVKHNCVIKEKQNDIISKNASWASKALILDSCEALSSKKLFEKGVYKENIHVPNPIAANVHRINQNGWSLAEKLHLDEYLKRVDVKKDKYTHVWFDYCGKYKTHMKDIDTFFNRRLFAENGSRFSVTYSMRGIRKEFININPFDKHKDEIINHIISVSQKNGYNLKCDNENTQFYGRLKGQQYPQIGVKSACSMLFLTFIPDT